MASGREYLTGLALACAIAAPAHAQVMSPEAFHGMAEIRATLADGERGWLDGGFGKSDDTGAQAVLEWSPRFNFALSGVVTGMAQTGTRPGVDLGEAYLKLKTQPTRVGRFSARAGLFYPPVSLEHDGVGWTTPDMLSASAINSWIGEEVKVAGVEGTWQGEAGAHKLEATAAVFGWNDTSGTLLTFRGWALHGVRTGLNTRFDLPPLSTFGAIFQPPETYPYRELDNRPGYYGRIAWRPPAPVSFNATFYDNGGNRIAIDAERQWAWETRFLNVGMTWEPREGTRVLAQAMNGETLMGYRMRGGIWFDVGFRAAYALASQQVGDDVVSGRLDAFSTSDRSFRALDDNTERGWALTGAWRHRLGPHAALLVEAQHIDSRRAARALASERARQRQSVLQTALRFSF